MDNKVIVLSHPTGNANVRAILQGLESAGALDSFHTTLSFRESDWLVRWAPDSFRQMLMRRKYDLPESKIVTHPKREMVRSIARKLGLRFLTEHEMGWACVDAIYGELDKNVASYVVEKSKRAEELAKATLSGVYCYEDGALNTFLAAKKAGIPCLYDLPTPYWKFKLRLLREEAERLPQWKPTIQGINDSAKKLARKDKELELADVIICASQVTLQSLPEHIRQKRKCIISAYGAPRIPHPHRKTTKSLNSPLRILFVGLLTQAKGLADLFTAMKLLNRSDVELIVIGHPLVEMKFYRDQYKNFVYETPRNHSAVLEFMQTCDVFVFPSLVEGRGLVQTEAMSCGLPLIATPNAASPDLIVDGKTGFLVPIRSPEMLAAKIAWFADNRDKVLEMGRSAKHRVAKLTWETYCNKILNTVLPLIHAKR